MRTKKAAMLRKARYQKRYYNALKIAAEMDEQALQGNQPLLSDRIVAGIAVVVTQILILVLGFGLKAVVEDYLLENNFSDNEADYVSMISAVSFIFLASAVYIFALFYIKNKQTIHTKVDLVKDLAYNKRKELLKKTIDLINRDDPKIRQIMKASITPKGTVDIKKLQQSLTRLK